MFTNKSKSLSELISAPSGGLSGLAEAARVRAELSDYLRKHLDPSVAPGLIHCNIRDDQTLVVLAASPAWAARLRFEAGQLMALCKQCGVEASAVKVRVSH